MPRIFPLAIVLSALGCGPTTQPREDTLAALFADSMTVIDLSHPVSANAPYWPGPDQSPFRHDTLGAHPDGAPSFAAYAAPEHFGTHLDAPVHFGMGLASVDRIPTTELFGPAVVVDISTEAETDADYALTAEDLRDWEAAHGPIPDGAIVLLRSGWAERWTQGDRYYNAGVDGVMHFPGFAVDAARFLIDERDVAGIGTDTGSVDTGDAESLAVHEIVNGSGRFHLENVADLRALPESGAYLIVAPIKIEGGSGGQVRIFAVLP